MTSAASAAAARIISPRLALYAPLRPAARAADSLRGNDNGNSTRISAKQRSILAFVKSLRRLNNEHNTIAEGRGPLFSGVEASLEDLGTDGTEREESAGLIREHGLELLVNIDIHGSKGRNNAKNEIANSSGTSPSSSSGYVCSFESQLRGVSHLGEVVRHVDCRGLGAENLRGPGRPAATMPWDDDAALDYLLDVLPLSASFLEDHPHVGRGGNETDAMGGAPDHLTGISHELTEGMLRRPDAVRHLLEVVPPLRLTANLSAWHGVRGHAWGSRGERKNGNDANGDNDIGDEDENEVLTAEIVPHVDLIRAARASVLSATAPDERVRTPRSLWEAVWTRKADRGVETVFATLDDDDDSLAARGNATGLAANDRDHETIRGTSEEDEHRPRMERLAHSAEIVHRHHACWSTRRALEKQLQQNINSDGMPQSRTHSGKDKDGVK